MKLQYRPEIDGLRGISVIAVILYHAKLTFFNIEFFKGGFIGVDIFFVISGYLISSIILKELIEKKKFSFQDYLIRRIRRIIPASIFAIILVLLASYFILLPQSLVDTAKSIASITFFISNIYFWFTGRAYGAESELLRPLLHFWSLSVEIQFYIFFPIFFIFIYRFFRKIIFEILLTFFILSFFFTIYLTKWHPSFSFYILFSRVFELTLGSLIAIFELKKLQNKSISRKIFILFSNNKYSPTLAIILIIYSFIFFDFNKIEHPSTITLIPLLGTALIIFFSGKKELIIKILSSKILVFFGIISFSLYLFHYPIFSFLRYIEIFDLSLKFKFLGFFLTFFLSIFSYKYIELKFRYKNTVSLKLLYYYIILSLIFIYFYIFYILVSDGIKNRFPKIITEEISYNLEIKNYHQGEKGNILLIGDSFASTLHYQLNEELKKIGFNLNTEIQHGCLFLKDAKQYLLKSSSLHEAKNCKNILKKIDFYKKQYGNLIIIYFQSWNSFINGYFQHDAIKKSDHERYLFVSNRLIHTIKYLSDKNKLILISQTPVFDKPGVVKEVLVDWSILNKLGFNREKFLPRIVSYDINKFYSDNEKFFDFLKKIKNNNVYILHPHNLFCDTYVKSKCVGNTLNSFLFKDETHLSLQGSKLVVKEILKTLEKIKY